MNTNQTKSLGVMALGEMICNDNMHVESIISHVKAIGDIYNHHFPIMHVNLITDDRNIENWEPGDIGKTSHYQGAWAICCPRGCGAVARLTDEHVVMKHGDGTISVFQSLIHGCIGFVDVRFEIDHNRIVYSSLD